jgi:ABC-type nickel/cobalt efflux system permease component RcnA
MSLKLGAFVITEISSANGYKNSASSNSYEVIHGPELTQKHSQRVKTIQLVQKLKGAMKTLGAHTCAKQECRNRAHAHDARLLSQKAVHLRNDAFMRVVGLPPTSGSASKLI